MRARRWRPDRCDTGTRIHWKPDRYDTGTSFCGISKVLEEAYFSIAGGTLTNIKYFCFEKTYRRDPDRDQADESMPTSLSKTVSLSSYEHSNVVILPTRQFQEKHQES